MYLGDYLVKAKVLSKLEQRNPYKWKHARFHVVTTGYVHDKVNPSGAVESILVNLGPLVIVLRLKVKCSEALPFCLSRDLICP